MVGWGVGAGGGLSWQCGGYESRVCEDMESEVGLPGGQALPPKGPLPFLLISFPVPLLPSPTWLPPRSHWAVPLLVVLVAFQADVTEHTC